MKRFKKLGFSYIKTSVPIVLHILSEFFVFFLLSFVALSLGTASMNAHLGL
jgi:MATE family multidrug resistance protein